MQTQSVTGMAFGPEYEAKLRRVSSPEGPPDAAQHKLASLLRLCPSPHPIMCACHGRAGGWREARREAAREAPDWDALLAEQAERAADVGGAAAGDEDQGGDAGQVRMALGGNGACSSPSGGRRSSGGEAADEWEDSPRRCREAEGESVFSSPLLPSLLRPSLLIAAFV